jgi:multicomponent K+:H+ antiporter subunit C
LTLWIAGASGQLGATVAAHFEAAGHTVVRLSSGPVADPLPQALVLTAIVIGFATTGFVIELALRSRHESGSDHVDGHEPGQTPEQTQGHTPGQTGSEGHPAQARGGQA